VYFSQKHKVYKMYVQPNIQHKITIPLQQVCHMPKEAQKYQTTANEYGLQTNDYPH